MPYMPIVATLGYVLSHDKQSVLMLHRNTHLEDQHYGKYNGLGGKLEPDEDIVSGMQREIHEEAGIIAHTLTLRGTVNWPGFGKHGEHWLGFIFRIADWDGIPYTHNPEGTLEWVNITAIATLPMWEGDHHFLPLVFDDDPRQFHAVMPYNEGIFAGWRVQRI